MKFILITINQITKGFHHYICFTYIKIIKIDNGGFDGK